jgi:hypothetical protein
MRFLKNTLLGLFLGSSIGLSGCGMFQSAIGTSQRWSENYSLLPGVTATSREMIDGNPKTKGQSTFPEGASSAVGISAFSEVEVRLPEKKSIHRFVIHSDDLKQFDLMADEGNGLLIIKQIKSVKSRPIEINISTVTDRLKLRVRKTTGDAALQRRRAAQGGFGRFGRRGVQRASAEIAEIELYGFASPAETATVQEKSEKEDELDRLLKP